MSKTAEPTEMSFFLGGGLTPVSSRNHVFDGVLLTPTRRCTFEGGHMPAVCMGTYLRAANVPAQRTWRMNPFVAARGDKRAMRPFAKLLWTLVQTCHKMLKTHRRA